MINKVNRFIPNGYKPFISSHDYKNHERILIKEKSLNNKIEYLNSLSEIFDKLNIPLCFKVSENHVMLLFVFPIILFGCAKSNQMLGR